MTTVEVLTPWVEQVVKEALGCDHLHRDADGDIPIGLTGGAIYVRLLERPDGMPQVQMFGPMLRDIEPTPTLYEKLNELNRDYAYLRFYFDHGIVWVSMDVVAESFRREDLTTALDAARFYDTNLARLLDLPDAKPWRDPPPSEGGGADGERSVDDGVRRELATAQGPAAHVEVPSKVLPDDASPADDAVNLRLGYL